MNVIKKLKIFDLDETLLRIPTYSSKRTVETDDLKFTTAYSFYDHPASLDDVAYDIHLIGPVYEDWKSGMADPETLCVLITHRKEHLREAVIKVLEKRGIAFDQYFFLGREHSKIDSTQKVISELEDLEEIEIYEDSIAQLSHYQSLFNRINSILESSEVKPYLIKLYIVDKSQMFRIENFTISEERRITLL